MKSFLNSWYGRFRGLRYFIAQIDIFIYALINSEKTFVINDWDFFVPLYYAKKIKPRLQVIHYNTEIFGKDVKCLKAIERFYKKHASFPDMIIECLKERATWRKKTFNIDKPIYVINNTIPAQNIDVDSNENLDKYYEFEQDKPILIYTGKASVTRQISEVVDCIDYFHDSVNFLFLCHGKEEEYTQLKMYMKENCHYKNYMIKKAVSRTALIKIMQHCQIGVNYYKPNISINHKYAAPGKIFEYMACGLNIITTNNEGVNHIVLENGIGQCIKGDESIKDTLSRLLNIGLKDKEYIQNIFRTKYCYEIDSTEAIEKVLCFFKKE